MGSNGAYPPGGEGLFAFTNNPRDQGNFCVPPIRNVALTAPYMHDGSIATLIDHYAVGGQTIADGFYAGVGSANPNKSGLVNEYA